MGRIFDDRGNRMSPSHTRKRGITYRYYISAPLLQGLPERTGTIRRVPAAEVEKIVADALRRDFNTTQKTQSNERLLNDHVGRVEVHPAKLVISVKAPKASEVSDRKPNRRVLQIPWKKPPSKRRRDIIPPASGKGKDPRPIRIETRATLIAAIAQGRTWLNELVTGTIGDINAIAAREGCSVRRVNMTISLAFLAPDLVKAAVEGSLPHGLGVTRLYDPPAEWSRQYLQLGLAQD